MTPFKATLALAALVTITTPAHAFDAPSGNYGDHITFRNNGSSLVLFDRDVGQTYILELNSAQDQAMPASFYDPRLYSNPITRRQRSFIRGFNVTNTKEVDSTTVRATAKLDLATKTIAGDVAMTVETDVLVKYEDCSGYYWWNHQPPRPRTCLVVYVDGYPRLTSFHSGLGETLNQAIGMTADIVFQAASALSGKQVERRMLAREELNQ